jgi:hypothetical protein
VTGDWQVSFPPKLGAPASAKFDSLSSWTDNSDPGIRFFSGTATYEKQIEIPAERLNSQEALYLDLGAVDVIADVELNGKNLGTLWKPPFRVRVDGAAKPGTNKLVVRVTNLWRNRLIGDAALPNNDVVWNMHGKGVYPAKWPDWLLQGQPRPGGRITFCTRKETYAAKDELFPSGLLGPVTLQSVVRADKL